MLESRSYISLSIVALALGIVTGCATTADPVPCEPQIKIVERVEPIPIWPDFSVLIDECIEPVTPPSVERWVAGGPEALDDGLTLLGSIIKTDRQCISERDAVMFREEQ